MWGGSGYEHVWPWEPNRLVTNCAGVLAGHLAETVIGAVIALNGNFPLYFRQQLQRLWKPHRFRPLSEQTMLIVGLGEIGQEVAKRGQALGMHIVGIRRKSIASPYIDELHRPNELRQIVGNADIVSIHVRLNEETTNLFDRDLLLSMKQGSLLLNSSRGHVVDELAMTELESGHLRGAYLDVFQQEPLAIESPLWRLPNVIITPHAADNAFGWPEKFTAVFIEKYEKWCHGGDIGPLNAN